MRVPVEWLHEYCAPDLPVDELATRLAMTGTEVDRVDHHGVRRWSTSSSAGCCARSSTPTPIA